MKRITVTALSILVLMLSAMPSGSVSAASNSLGVNPRRDYVVKAGDELTETLVVSNLSKTEDLNITVRIVDFEAKDQTGSPSLLLKRQEPTRWSLKPYITLPKTVTVAAGKSTDVPFTITIPKDTGAGSFYSAIQYSTDGGDSGQNVTLASSSATLMFVRVPGEARNNLTLENFGAFTPNADRSSGAYATFYGSAAPKYLSYALNNKGNVAEQPVGSVSLKNMFGKEVSIIEDANPSKNIVLIDQTRRIDLCLNEERGERKDPDTGRTVETVDCKDFKLMPGRYTAQLALLYGDNGSSSRELNATASFWYLPAWSIILLVVVLALIAGLVYFIVRKLKGGRRGARR
ncbi:MAG TPA: hypothetical protein VK983_01210 [Candidatus Limnocylindrales bacterium]|nr:hypothetical protein [Candidatus Limnocylindrales bacterium]